MLRRSVQDGDVDGALLGRGAILDPGTELVKQTGWLTAGSARAVAETRDLVVPVEVVNVWEQSRDFVVVLLGALVWNQGIPLYSG